MYKHITPVYKLIIAIALTTFSLALACSKPQQNSSIKHQAEMREVADESGKVVRVQVRPQRIITLAPNLTEIVYAVGAGNRLVGNTTYCNYPPEAVKVEKVGDTLQPNIERIIALRPDVILVSTASQLETFTSQLNERGIAVFVTDPHDLEGVLRSIHTVGEILGQAAEAEKLISNLRARADAIENRVKALPAVSVFYQVSPSPLWTAGRKSWITDLIRRAGGKSVTGEVEGEWMRYSDEAAMASRPDAIIMATGDGPMEVASALKRSPAAINKRVYGINGDFLSRPGPRLVDGLEQISRALHPEAFTTQAP